MCVMWVLSLHVLAWVQRFAMEAESCFRPQHPFELSWEALAACQLLM